MTAVNLTKLPGTLTGISKVSCLWQFSEWYLASGKRYKVQKIDSQNVVALSPNQKKENCFLTFVRKVSYITGFLWIATTFIRKSHRKKYFFKVQTKPTKVPKPTQPQHQPPKQWSEAVTELLLLGIKLGSKIYELTIKNMPLETNSEILEILHSNLQLYQTLYDNLNVGNLTDLIQVREMIIQKLHAIYPKSPPSFLNPSTPCHLELLQGWEWMYTKDNFVALNVDLKYQIFEAESKKMPLASVLKISNLVNASLNLYKKLYDNTNDGNVDAFIKITESFTKNLKKIYATPPAFLDTANSCHQELLKAWA